MGRGDVPTGITYQKNACEYEHNTCDYEDSEFCDSHIPSGSLDGNEGDQSESVGGFVEPESGTSKYIGSHHHPESVPSESEIQLDTSDTSDTPDTLDTADTCIGYDRYIRSTHRIHPIIKIIGYDRYSLSLFKSK